MNQLELIPQLKNILATPILKWAGGKNSLIPQFKPYFPVRTHYSRYFEPFVGGGAVFFYLQPENSYLFDINSDLIELYTVVRDNVEELIEALSQHYNDKDYYYEVRAWKPSQLTPIQRAARLIFLNHTCYNGLYRVNKEGQFNVPFGKYKNPTICDKPGLRASSIALQRANLEVGDFETIRKYGQKGDFVYFDPPYEPISETSNFTSYTTNGFSKQDQSRLAEIFTELDKRGCLLMLSNSNAPLIYELYDKFNIHEISARRAINRNPEGRGKITELLVTNFLPDVKLGK